VGLVQFGSKSVRRNDTRGSGPTGGGRSVARGIGAACGTPMGCPLRIREVDTVTGCCSQNPRSSLRLYHPGTNLPGLSAGRVFGNRRSRPDAASLMAAGGRQRCAAVARDAPVATSFAHVVWLPGPYAPVGSFERSEAFNANCSAAVGLLPAGPSKAVALLYRNGRGVLDRQVRRPVSRDRILSLRNCSSPEIWPWPIATCRWN